MIDKICMTGMLLASLFCAAPALAADSAKTAKTATRTELKLVPGVNDFKLRGNTIRIIKGYVSTGNAHSHSTFTVFLPGVQGANWLHVRLDDKVSRGLVMANSEAAEASVRAVAFYMLNGQLYAVQATKMGLEAPDLYDDKATVELRVSRFDEDWDDPNFVRTSVKQAKLKYVDAAEALKNEFFNAP